MCNKETSLLIAMGVCLLLASMLLGALTNLNVLCSLSFYCHISRLQVAFESVFSRIVTWPVSPVFFTAVQILTSWSVTAVFHLKQNLAILNDL
jgi:hypothetical protein